MTKKIHKYLKKPCPNCGEIRLVIIEVGHTNEDGTIIYDDYIECQECEFREDLSNKHKRDKDEYGRRL
jgi:DNA-directed RNA polymerase subunit RPC12/RpoP